jgi:hypothetical protein
MQMFVEIYLQVGLDSASKKTTKFSVFDKKKPIQPRMGGVDCHVITGN